MQNNNNELDQENEHIKFWESCLNDLTKQFEIIIQFIDLTKKFKSQRESDLSYILTKYRNDSKQYTKEPSHIYYLCEIFFDFITSLWSVINKSTNELYSNINSMSDEIIKDIENKKNEACKASLLILNECQKLIDKIKMQENEFQKIKSSMDNAQINQNNIKKKYTYNVAEIKKADLLLAEQIRKMEEIKIPMEENKKKLNEFRTKLYSSLRDSFEKVLFTYFKHLANLHQYFFLLLNNKKDIITNMKKKLGTAISQLTNLSFDLNDYTEKKFGELIGVKYDSIIMFDSEELINKSSTKLLLKISYDIINYIQVFMICLRYRKKIIKIFSEVIKSIIRCEETNNKNFETSYRGLINKLNSLKNISEGTSKYWNIFFLDLKQNDNEYKTIISGIDNYIISARNEFNKFKLNWTKYEDKIKEGQKISIEFLKEKNDSKLEQKEQKELNDKNKKKDEKFREIIKSVITFINSNVYDIRERDKKEISKLSLIFEKAFQKYRNIVNKKIDSTEEQISNLVSLDIFEECKIIIIKYFNNFKISNYENYLDKMRVKLLLNTQLNNEIISKQVIEKLNDINDKDDFFNTKSSNFEDSQSQILLDNEENISEEKKINTFLESKKSISQNLLFENINKNSNLKNNKNIFFDNLKKNNNNSFIDNIKFEKDNKKEVEKEFYIKEIFEEDDSLDLLDKNKFTELTKIENPYKNIKEEELIRLKLISQNKDRKFNELEEGEKKLDSFNCALKEKILLQGKLNITTKKIEFNSLFNPVTVFGKTTIIIPLKDIIEIQKKYNLALDNSIEIKTEKVSYTFINFLSRDKCYNLLENEINKLKEKKNIEHKIKNEKKEKVTPENIYLKKKRFKSKEVVKMLEDINFNSRLKQLTKERIAILSKKYKDEKNGIFLPDDKFSKKFGEHIFKSCPLYICFKYICNISTQLDELGHSKGFFESLLIENYSKDVIMIEKDENNNDKSNIPEYFNNDDYIMDLFCSFNKNEFENLLNEAQNWPHKYEYTCHGMNKSISTKNEKEDIFTIYFVSPTLLILDIIGYSSGIKYNNNFIPISRYRFDSTIKYNKNKGKFDFITKLTILFEVIFLPNCILSGNWTNKIFNKSEELTKNLIFPNLINIVDSYVQIFSDIYEKMTEEIFQKKIKMKQNMITGEYEEEILDELSEDLETNINDIINDINSDINNKSEIKNDNSNIIYNNDIINNEDNLKKINKMKTGKIKENIKEENKKINNSEDSCSIQNKRKKKDKEYILLIIIILILIGIIISLLYSKQGKTKTDFNIIINLIILGTIIYLLKNK